jgi:hypothetical protein
MKPLFDCAPVRPGNALNFCCSAIAALVRSP